MAAARPLEQAAGAQARRHPVRPLGVGEILDGSIATLRRHWRAIIGVTFTVALLTQGIGVVLQGLLVDDSRIKTSPTTPIRVSTTSCTPSAGLTPASVPRSWSS